MRLSKVVPIAVALLGAGTVRAGVINFTFNGVPPVTGTPLSVSSGGLMANFSSPSDPAAFIVINDSGALTYTDNVIVTNLPNVSNAELDITFSQPVTSFSAVFATDGPGPLDLTALIGGLGGTTVGSTSQAGTIPAGYPFPEGTITFSGPSFDSLMITDPTDPAFAIGDFSVTANITTPVPEPSSLALAALALAGLALAGRLRKA